MTERYSRQLIVGFMFVHHFPHAFVGKILHRVHLCTNLTGQSETLYDWPVENARGGRGTQEGNR
ncbi:hypothetical protein BCEN4_190071 [Burkholderia cenocepacia]|nr:hypothetical protein BCEN4_190071 [Burkholderia cenocepacia]